MRLGNWSSTTPESRASMFVNSDWSDLLGLFNAGGVRYLVIGGYAVIQYAQWTEG